MRPSALLRKSFSSASWQSWRATSSGPARDRAVGRCRKHFGSTLQQLGMPLADLIGWTLKLLGQLDQRLVAANGGQRHLRLEGR